LPDDAALVEVAATIHRAVATEPPADAVWGELALDPVEAAEILCPNDLVPWNLVRIESGWVFIAECRERRLR